MQYDNVGLPGRVYDLYVLVEPGDSDFELEGSDADWDFTTSVIDLLGTAIFTYPEPTPYGMDHPESDLAVVIITNINGEYTYSNYDLVPAASTCWLRASVTGPRRSIPTRPPSCSSRSATARPSQMTMC